MEPNYIKEFGEITAPVKEERFVPEEDPRRFRGLVEQVEGKMVKYLQITKNQELRMELIRTTLAGGKYNDFQRWTNYLGVQNLKFQSGAASWDRSPSAGAVLAVAGMQTEVIAAAVNEVEEVLRMEEKKTVGWSAVDRMAAGAMDLYPLFQEIGVNGRGTWVLDKSIANPIVAYHVEREFTRWAREPTHYGDEKLVWGYLFGYFDDHPQADYFRQKLLPQATQQAPEVILEMQAKERAKSQDSSRLRRLKGFWGKVFEEYWVALSRNEERAPTGLEARPKPAAWESLPDEPRRGIAMMEFNRARARLNHELMEVIGGYNRGGEVTFAMIKAVFNHGVSHDLFAYAAEGLRGKEQEQKMEEVVAGMEKIVDPKAEVLPKIFGTDWEKLAAVEKVALMGYCAFASNGAMVTGAERAVAAMQQRLVPELNRHNDGVKKERQSTAMESPVFDLKTYAERARKARERLERLGLKDGVVTADYPPIINEIETRKELFMEVAEILRKEYEETGPEPETVGKTRIKNLLQVGSVVALFWGYAVPDATGVSWLGAGVISAMTWRLHKREHQKWASQFKRQVKLLWEGIEEVAGEWPKDKARRLVEAVRMTILVAGIALGANVAGKEVSRIVYDVGEGLKARLRGESGTEGKYENDRVRPGLGNSPELKNRGGEAKFYAYFDKKDSGGRVFWMDQACDTELEGGNVVCASELNSPWYMKGGQRFESETEMKQYIQDQVGQGNIVRLNLNGSGHFQIPAGYMPSRTIGFKVTPEMAIFSPLAGMEVVGSASESGGMLGVVYTQTNTDGYDEGFAVEIGEAAVKPEDFERQEMTLIKPIFEWAREKMQSRDETGMSNRDILEGIRQKIGELGIGYGFADYKPKGNSHAEILADMFAPNPDGSPRNKRMICNMFSYGVGLIAETAGMETKLLTGYVQEKSDGWGGQDAMAHQVVVFKNESGRWEAFDSTLPGPDNPTYLTGESGGWDIFAEMENQERERQKLLLVLGAIGAGTIAAMVGVSEKRVERWRKRKQEKQKKYQRTVEGARYESAAAAYIALRWLADKYDKPESSQAYGSAQEAARMIGENVWNLVTDEKEGFGPGWEEEMKRQLEEDTKYLQTNEGERPDWLRDEGTMRRVKEGGRWVVKYLNERSKSEYQHLNGKQREQLGQLRKLLQRAMGELNG